MATSVDLEEINVEYINRTSDECNTSTNTGIKNDQSITVHTTPKDNSNSTTDGRGRYPNRKDNLEPLEREGGRPEKILKIVVTVLLFLVVGICSFIIKITVFIISRNIYSNANNFTEDNTESNITTNNSKSAFLKGGNISTSYLLNASIVDDIDCSNCNCVDRLWIWAMFFIIIAPYLQKCVSCLSKFSYKWGSMKPVHIPSLIFVIVTEGFHSIGLTTITFLILPTIDPFRFVQIAWTIGCLPCLLELIEVIQLKKTHPNYQSPLSWIWEKMNCKLSAYYCNIVLTISALLLQVVGIVLLGIRLRSINMIAVYTFSILFISIRYWENFIETTETDNETSCSFSLRYLKIRLHDSRSKVSFITHLWKIVMTFFTMISIFLVRSNSANGIFKALFGDGYFVFSGFPKDITIGLTPYNNRSNLSVVLILHITCGFIMYKASKTACRIRCQIIGFYLPIMTSAAISGIFFQQIYVGHLSENFGISAFDTSHLDMNLFDDNLLYPSSILLFISTFILLAKYNWKHGYIQAKTSRIFVSGMFCGIFSDVSMLLNRRRNDNECEVIIGKTSQIDTSSAMIYACATLWHENINEMEQLMISIFRMDRSHYVESRFQNNLTNGHPENQMYEFDFEVHLFFDDAIDRLEEAVPHLLQRMRKYSDVGAACGRIHPTGRSSSLMVWYQKFEYAVSHWLQKATEHVIGCVLCSPGCFSLFRGSALTEILEEYSKQPEEAHHVIQYDQGEDRWLCTLLLRARFRIDYCAESDAKTYVPETFEEFFKQRRRWIPSTLANVIDLIIEARTVCAKNNKITRLYILYQLLYCISSILTPGTIIMMMYGALVLIIGDTGETITGFVLLFVILIPVITFICICMFKKDKQILCAQIVSFILFVLMVLVIAGVIRSAVEEKLCSTSTMFLCFIVGVFISATILHPKESGCVKHCLLYFIAIPCTSIVLFLYSIANMNDEKWGTREGHEMSNKDEESTKNTEQNENTNMKNHLSETEKGSSTTGSKIFCNDQLPEDEKKFWERKLEGCLKPLAITGHTDEVKTKLDNLRNSSLILVLIVNTLAIILMFSLEYSSSINETLSIQIPCQSNYIIIRPISFMFSIVFGVLLCIQFVMMIVHRWSTALHILSTTDIFPKEKDEMDLIWKDVYFAFQNCMDIIITNESQLEEIVNENRRSMWQFQNESLAKQEELSNDIIREMKEKGCTERNIEIFKSALKPVKRITHTCSKRNDIRD